MYGFRVRLGKTDKYQTGFSHSDNDNPVFSIPTVLFVIEFFPQGVEKNMGSLDKADFMLFDIE